MIKTTVVILHVSLHFANYCLGNATTSTDFKVTEGDLLSPIGPVLMASSDYKVTKGDFLTVIGPVLTAQTEVIFLLLSG